jgi:hypothetical protein
MVVRPHRPRSCGGDDLGQKRGRAGVEAWRRRAAGAGLRPAVVDAEMAGWTRKRRRRAADAG